MKLPSKNVYQILKEKGVNNIHHANSVITSCQFLRNGALLSRDSIVRRGLFQTPQYSDHIDKKYGIWPDIFTDSVDIHDRKRNINYYGPVLLVLDINFLEKIDGGLVWVTKLNPVKWNETNDDKRWFTSISDLEKHFIKGEFDQMIVFRNCGGELSIKECLTQIILDDSQQETREAGPHYFKTANDAIKLSMIEGGINVPIIKRKCSNQCSCVDSYTKDSKRTKIMYSFN